MTYKIQVARVVLANFGTYQLTPWQDLPDWTDDDWDELLLAYETRDNAGPVSQEPGDLVGAIQGESEADGWEHDAESDTWWAHRVVQ